MPTTSAPGSTPASTITPALAKLPTEGRGSRVNVSLNAQLTEDVQLYAKFYEESYMTPLTEPKLLAAIIEQFISNDTQFKKWRRDQPLTPAPGN